MIRKPARLVALALFITQLVASIPLSASAQTAPDKQPASQEKPLKLRADEVIVDAVVLDKKSHAVSDFTAGDFELYEDGGPRCADRPRRLNQSSKGSARIYRKWDGAGRLRRRIWD